MFLLTSSHVEYVCRYVTYFRVCITTYCMFLRPLFREFQPTLNALHAKMGSEEEKDENGSVSL